MADFLVNWTEAQQPEVLPDLKKWTMHFDGSKNYEGSGAGVVLTSPKGDKLRYVLQIHFTATNNVTEYEALLHDMKVMKELGVKRIYCYGDSDLVVQQTSGTCDANSPNMEAYRKTVDQFGGSFTGYELIYIDQRKNEEADALSRLKSKRESVPPRVFLDHIHSP